MSGFGTQLHFPPNLSLVRNRSRAKGCVESRPSLASIAGHLSLRLRGPKHLLREYVVRSSVSVSRCLLSPLPHLCGNSQTAGKCTGVHKPGGKQFRSWHRLQTTPGCHLLNSILIQWARPVLLLREPGTGLEVSKCTMPPFLYQLETFFFPT